MKKNLGNTFLGEFVLVRSKVEGINAGFLQEIDETGVVLATTRRLWYHKPKNKTLSWYEGVALSGVHEDSILSPTVPFKIIVENYSITPCTEEAKESILNHPTHPQLNGKS